MNKPILITGATGTVGSEVVQALLKKGANIRVGVRDTSKLQNKPWTNQVELVELDYDKPDTLKNALNNVSKIFLVTPPGSYREKEISGLVLAQADPSMLKQIVRLSGMGADKHNLFANHYAADKLLLDSEIDYTALQPNTFMQNFINYQPNVIKQHKIIEPVADGKMSYIDARDIGEVSAQILLDSTQAHANKFYELTGDQSLNCHEVAEIFSRVLNTDFTYEPTTFAEYIQLKQAEGVPIEFAEKFTQFYQMVIDGDYESISADARNILNRPTTTLEQFVEDYKQQFAA